MDRMHIPIVPTRRRADPAPPHVLPVEVYCASGARIPTEDVPETAAADLVEAAGRVTLRGLAATIGLRMHIDIDGFELRVRLYFRVPCVKSGVWTDIGRMDAVDLFTLKSTRGGADAWLQAALWRMWAHERDEAFCVAGAPMFSDPEREHAKAPEVQCDT